IEPAGDVIAQFGQQLVVPTELFRNGALVVVNLPRIRRVEAEDVRERCGTNVVGFRRLRGGDVQLRLTGCTLRRLRGGLAVFARGRGGLRNLANLIEAERDRLGGFLTTEDAATQQLAGAALFGGRRLGFGLHGFRGGGCRLGGRFLGLTGRFRHELCSRFWSRTFGRRGFARRLGLPTG